MDSAIEKLRQDYVKRLAAAEALGAAGEEIARLYAVLVLLGEPAEA